MKVKEVEIDNLTTLDNYVKLSISNSLTLIILYKF